MSEHENRARNPRVFISYSWDSPEHRLWVESFAQELRKSGIDARLDAWRDESQSIDDFMMVELERADFVLAICTPDFKRKIVENAEGTATASGFEMGTAAALRRMGGKDVVPVLRAGEWTEAAPSSLLSYRFYDFTQADVSGEFTQLRDRLLGHIRRPPELGKASGPAAAPELPDIFAKGQEPEPQPTAPPVSAPEGNSARSGPTSESLQQPSQIIIQQVPTGYSKAKVWGTVGAVFLGLVVLWNITPDPEMTSDAAPQSMAGPEQSATDRWTSTQTGTSCAVSKEVAPGSWLQLTYETGNNRYSIASYDNNIWPALGVQAGVPYPRQVVFQLDDDVSTAKLFRVTGYDWSGYLGVYIWIDNSAYIEDLADYYFLNLYHYDAENPQDYVNQPILSLDLTGSIDGIDRFMNCVAGL